MKTKDIVTVGTIVVLTIVAGFLFYEYQTFEREPRTAIEYGNPVPTPKLDRIYTNPQVGFGLRYSSDYTLTGEDFTDMSETRSTRINELILTFEDTERLGHPRLNLYVNATVPTERAERTLTFVQDYLGIYVVETFKDRTLDDDEVRTVGSIVMSDDNVYTWEFVFDRGPYDYGPELEAMIANFGLYQNVPESEEEAVDTEEELD